MMDFKNYPHLERDEFAEVCHFLDRQYRQATLGPLRRRWRLQVCTALATAFGMDSDHRTYVQITRPLQGSLDHGGLSYEIERFSLRDDVVDATQDQEMMVDEDGDEVRHRALVYANKLKILTPRFVGGVKKRHKR